MIQSSKLITNPLIERLANCELLKDRSPETFSSIERVLNAYLSRLNFTYNRKQDFEFLDGIITEMAEMFFEEKLVIAAESFFKNDRLGGTISDEMVNATIISITTEVLTMLSIDYKIRLSMYLSHVRDDDTESNAGNNLDDLSHKFIDLEELNRAITQYVYFKLRNILVTRANDYNRALVPTKEKK